MKANIKGRLSSLGVVQDGSALAILIDALVDEVAREFQNHDTIINRFSDNVSDVKNDLDWKVTKVTQSIDLIKNHPVNNREVAEILWTKLTTKREQEKDEFVQELEKI